MLEIEVPADKARQAWSGWLAVALPGVVLVGFLVWASQAGLPGSEVLLGALAVSVTQVLPGVVVWRWLRPRQGWWLEDIALGFVIGSMLAILAQLPAGLLGSRWLGGVLPLALAGALLAVPSVRARVRSAQTAPLPWWWGAGIGALSLTAVPQLRAFVEDNPVFWTDGGFRQRNADGDLHIALTAQLKERGPTTFPWVESEPLGYHYLSHAWAAQTSAISGLSPDDVIYRFMPMLFPVLSMLAIGVVAVRFSGRLWAGPVTVAIATLVGMSNPFGVVLDRFPLTPLSPTVAPSVGMLMLLLLLIAFRARGVAMPWPTHLLVLVLATVAAGAKGSTVPLVVAGLALGVVAMLFLDRSKVRPLFVDLVLVTGGLLLALVLVFRGSGAGLQLDLHDAAEQTAWLAPWVGIDSTGHQLLTGGTSVATRLSSGLLGLLFVGFAALRRRPELWVLAGAVLAGCGAVGVFAHPGRSQNYFAQAAIPVLALISTVVLVEAVRRWGRALLVPGLISVAGGLAFTYLPPRIVGGFLAEDPGRVVAMLAWGAGFLVVAGLAGAAVVRFARGPMSLRSAALLTAVLAAAALLPAGTAINLESFARPIVQEKPVLARWPFAVSMQELDAARWIRDHSERNDLVMTNRHCGQPVDPVPGCDSRRWMVAAYSQRQLLLEGWTATPRSAKEGPEGRDSITVPYWHPELLALNDGFIAAPTAAAGKELRDLGVRWIYADNSRPVSPDLGRFATKRFENRDVTVYEFETD